MSLTAYHYLTQKGDPIAGGEGTPPPSVTFEQMVLSKSPTAYWRLGDSGSTAVDETGTQDGTLGGSPTTGVTGITSDGDDAMTFVASSSQYIEVPHNAAFNIGTGDFSIMFGLNVTAWPATTQFLLAHSGLGNPGDWGLAMYGGTDGTILVYLQAEGHGISTGITHAATGFHLIGVSVDRSNRAELWVDGAKAPDSADVSAKSGFVLSITESLHIACRGESGTRSLYADATIDEVALWNGSLLTGTDWSDIYGTVAAGVPSTGNIAIPLVTVSGTGTVPPAATFASIVSGLSPDAWWRLGDASGTVTDEIGSLDLTASGSPTYGATGITSDGDDAMTFAAVSSQFLSRANDAVFEPGTSDFSLTMAFNIASWPSGEHYYLAGHDDGGGSGEWGFYLARYAANRIDIKLDGSTFLVNSDATLAGTGWHLITFALDRSGNASVYVDDEATETVDISAKVSANLTSGRVLYVGASNDAAECIDGSLDEVIWWGSTLLTEADHDAMYGAL